MIAKADDLTRGANAHVRQFYCGSLLTFPCTTTFTAPFRMIYHDFPSSPSLKTAIKIEKRGRIDHVSTLLSFLFLYLCSNKEGKQLACVASVSVRFRSKELGTRVKDRAKNGTNKRAGKELPFPCPSPLFHFLVLVLFLARSKPKIPFHGLFLFRNQTETLATQAKLQYNGQISVRLPCF